MAPSRDDIADAITAFLKQKDVPYIQAMTSQTIYHRRFLEKFNERTSMRDCCVVTQFEISKNLTKTELDKILDGLLMEAGFSPGTVMLTTEEDFMWGFLLSNSHLSTQGIGVCKPYQAIGVGSNPVYDKKKWWTIIMYRNENSVRSDYTTGDKQAKDEVCNKCV